MVTDMNIYRNTDMDKDMDMNMDVDMDILYTDTCT
jgi:hypothetical protein